VRNTKSNHRYHKYLSITHQFTKDSTRRLLYVHIIMYVRTWREELNRAREGGGGMRIWEVDGGEFQPSWEI